MTGMAQTLLTIDEIDLLARGLLALSNHDQDELDAGECSRLIWQQSPELGPMATHLAELRLQIGETSHDNG